MMRRPSPWRSAALIPVAALSACAVGPNFHTPAAPTETAYTPQPIATAGSDQRFVPGAKVEGKWWTQFHSPQLDALIERALAANSDLAAAQAALKVARETWLAQRGILVPQIDAGATTSRSKSSQFLAPVPNETVFDYSLQTAQLNVGYTLDLFGGNRRQVEQARAQYEAQRYQTEAARFTLCNNVAAAAFQEASLRQQVAAQQRIVAIEEEVLGVMRRQLSDGQIAGADVLTQEAALAQALAALPPLRKALTQQQDLLAYLTGRSPGDGPI
jgi:NodT family efflux transporter outer membrane factor (OMF) lipoprotein